MQWVTQKKLAACEMRLALLLLSTVAVHSYQTIISLLETEKWKKPPYKVWENINDIASKMKDTQRWQGYIITGKEICLRTYQLQVQAVSPRIKNTQPSIREPNKKHLLHKLQLNCKRKIQSKFYFNVDIKFTLIIINDDVAIQAIYLLKLQSLKLLRLLNSLLNKLNDITNTT